MPSGRWQPNLPRLLRLSLAPGSLLAETLARSPKTPLERGLRLSCELDSLDTPVRVHGRKRYDFLVD